MINFKRTDEKKIPIFSFLSCSYSLSCSAFFIPSVLNLFSPQLTRNHQEASLTMERRDAPFLSLPGQKDKL